MFISYRRADCPDAVARLYENLVRSLRNQKVFYDHAGIEFGAEFPQILRDRVAAASVVLVCIGPNWVKQLHSRPADQVDFVREEIKQALAAGKTVIPILLGGNELMPTAADLEGFSDLTSLLAKNAIKLRPDP